MLAPRSRITTGRCCAGITEAIAGRSTPGRVFSTTLAIAIRAPVLPAETAAAAAPSFTALIASRMLVLRPWRRATDGFASPATESGVWCDGGALAQLRVPGQQRLEARRVPEQQEAQIRLLLEHPRSAVDDDRRRGVAAHGVQSDGQAHRQRMRHAGIAGQWRRSGASAPKVPATPSASVGLELGQPQVGLRRARIGIQRQRQLLGQDLAEIQPAVDHRFGQLGLGVDLDLVQRPRSGTSSLNSRSNSATDASPPPART